MTFSLTGVWRTIFRRDSNSTDYFVRPSLWLSAFHSLDHLFIYDIVFTQVSMSRWFGWPQACDPITFLTDGLIIEYMIS